MKFLTVGLLAGLMMALACSAQAASLQGPGMQMLETENYAGARNYFQSVLQQNPANAQAAAGLASVNLAEGQNKAGVDWAQKAIALAPNVALYHMLLGVAYGQYVHDVSIFSQLGIAYKVRDAFQQAVQLDPENGQARAGLAKYYILAPGIAGGNLEKAGQQISALDKLDPVQAAAVRATWAEHDKNTTQAESELRTAAKLDASGNGDYWLGDFLLKQKHYADAVQAFENGIHRNAGNSLNYFGVGAAAAEGKLNIGPGIQDLQKFLAMPHDWLPGTPTYKQAHYRLGQLYAVAGDKSSEKAQYSAALDLDPNYQAARAALQAGSR
ncbi:MAG: tetratricopeptide repeat protein [Gammaproteobacteria bacterium]